MLMVRGWSGIQPVLNRLVRLWTNPFSSVIKIHWFLNLKLTRLCQMSWSFLLVQGNGFIIRVYMNSLVNIGDHGFGFVSSFGVGGILTVITRFNKESASDGLQTSMNRNMWLNLRKQKNAKPKDMGGTRTTTNLSTAFRIQTNHDSRRDWLPTLLLTLKWSTALVSQPRSSNRGPFSAHHSLVTQRLCSSHCIVQEHSASRMILRVDESSLLVAFLIGFSHLVTLMPRYSSSPEFKRTTTGMRIHTHTRAHIRIYTC